MLDSPYGSIAPYPYTGRASKDGSTHPASEVTLVMSEPYSAPLRKVRPLRGQILVFRDKCKNKIGSLFVPQDSETWPPFGTVVDVGPPAVGPGGVDIPPDVKVGDRVLFSGKLKTPHAKRIRMPRALAPDVREGDPNGWERLVMLDAENILGIVEEE